MKSTLLLIKRFSLILLVFAAIGLVQCGSTKKTYEASLLQHRKKYKAKFNKEPYAPIKGAQLKGMDFFAPDSTYRVMADVVLIKNKEAQTFETSSDQTREYVPFVKLFFQLAGVENELTVYKSIQLQRMPEYRDYLFLPFNDLTNGEETYGGGRYIDLLITDIKNDQLLLDFNKAYNPYCAYSVGYSCPIPPANNKLSIPIRAGEKDYQGKYIYDRSH